MVPRIAFALAPVGFAIVAIEPRFPRTWLLEHVPTVLVLPSAVHLCSAP